MRRKRALAIAILFILSLFVSVNMSQENLVYSVAADNHTMGFIPSPELGYIVKSSSKITALRHLNNTLSNVQNTNTKLFDISGRNDMIVVLGKETPALNKSRINLLSRQSETTYVSPLFLVQGQAVAVMPDIIVRLKDSDNYDKLSNICAQLDCTISHKLLYTEKEYNISSAARNASDVFAIVEILNSSDFIEWAFPSIAFQTKNMNELYEYAGRVEPDDTYFDNQWHLDMIQAPEAWGYTKGDPNIIIAVLDDGIQIAHPDLINNIWINQGEIPGNGIDDDGNYRIDDIHGWDFYYNRNEVNPYVSSDGHGTACAGLIAAQGDNNSGVTGVTWNCTILPVKISHDNNFKTDENIASAIRYAAISGADIISNSWGTLVDSTAIHSAIKDVTGVNGIGRDGKGCVVLFSSGNWAEGGDIVYPAKYPEVIAVGAIDNNYLVWYYSGSGPELDFVAPSGDVGLQGNVWTTDLVGTSGYNNRDSNILDYTDKMGGTSGSCPIAAGVAALIFSVDPNLTCNEVKSIMVDSAFDLGSTGWDVSYGYGCLDAYSAVSLVLNPRELTIYVDVNAPSDPGPDNPEISDSLEDGSLEHPFDTIQEAIDISIYKDTIVVLPGIYKGQGNVDIDLSGKVITVKSLEGAESCIIDCQSQNRAFYFHNGERAHSVIDGFTIRNGSDENGGGICVEDSSPTISNCIITGNSASNGGGIAIINGGALIKNTIFLGNIAESRGGGLYGKDFGLILRNCTFQENESYSGGGVYFLSANNVNFSNCTFVNNQSESSGGGIYSNSNIDMSDCVFTGNTAETQGGGSYFNNSTGSIFSNCKFMENISHNGGGLYIYQCDQIFNDCTFTKNSVNSDGGAILCSDCTNLIFNNCTFSENISNRGGGINIHKGTPTLNNCIFEKNSSQNDGGGIYCINSDALIINCDFNQNISGNGGGLYTESGHPTTEGCVFNNNSVSNAGGGIYTYGSKLRLTNCILSYNVAYYGGGLYGESNSYDIKNCTFYGNTGGGVFQMSGGCSIHSCILWNNGQDLYGYVYTNGCWVQTSWVDPKFGPRTPNSGDPLFADPVNGDFHLKSQAGRWDSNSQSWVKDNETSPCIDSGPESENVGQEIWPNGSRINMGAYGGTTQASLSQSGNGDKRDLDNNYYISWDDILILALDWASDELPLQADFDYNGQVDLDDLSLYYGNWKASYVNEIPEFQSVKNQYVSISELLTFSVSASDSDSTNLNYTVLGLPENAEFSDMVFSWIPEQVGTYPITFVVSDNKSLNYMTVNVIVKAN